MVMVEHGQGLQPGSVGGISPVEEEKEWKVLCRNFHIKYQVQREEHDKRKNFSKCIYIYIYS